MPWKEMRECPDEFRNLRNKAYNKWQIAVMEKVRMAQGDKVDEREVLTYSFLLWAYIPRELYEIIWFDKQKLVFNKNSYEISSAIYIMFYKSV